LKGAKRVSNQCEKLLKTAEKYDQLCKQLGPFDPAYAHFAREREWAFNAALLAEKAA
jgi:hypothetical protein